MNKKSTLLAAAFMAVSSLTVSAAPGDTVLPADWTAGNYYYLKAGDNYLSLSGERADSVYFKTIASTANKAVRDSALWEITKVRTETGGNAIYQFKNKKTKALLSFSPADYNTVLAEGVSEWSISDDGKIVSYLADDKLMAFSLKDTKEFVLSDKKEEAKAFTVTYPESSLALKANELGENFSVFKLSFGGEFEGDIFSGKDIIAKSAGDNDDEYLVTLQVKGDETFDNSTPKYFGVDTVVSQITPAEGVFGARFVLDSTYVAEEGVHTVGNETFQQFKFLVDLKNDSLAMFVNRAPIVNGELKSSTDKVRVVYTKTGSTQLLTVSERKDANDNTPVNGVAPFITVAKGTPAEISGGTGVYFLKSASKTTDGGKYISSYKEGQIVTMTGTPSVNQLEGQWYIKEEGGMYSIVDRKSNTSMLLKGEVFAVQGMPNTFTFGGKADSITVEAQKVNMNDKYLGSRHFTKEDLANIGYVLNLLPVGAETSNSYTFTSDSLLQVTNGDAKDAVIFKLDSVGVNLKEGAQKLNDTISVVTYKLKSQFRNKYVAYDKDKNCLKITTVPEDAIEFRFNTSAEGGKYDMQIVSGNNVTANKYITADLASSNMILSETPAYFNFVEMDAPEYLSFESHHKRYTSNMKSLTMNPLNFFAEAKQEGQEILKSGYEKDNFSLWTIRSEASTAEKPLYFITTSLPNVNPEADRIRYYMVTGGDSLIAENESRLHFIANDTIETMKDTKNNPALFAFKVTESGNYLLENQKEVNNNSKTPFVGIINNFVVMTENGMEFSIESVDGPVANEAIDAPNTIKVIGGNGDLNILNASGKKVTLSNVLGQAIATRVLSSDNETIAAARGIVIVSVEGERAYKVIVK